MPNLDLVVVNESDLCLELQDGGFGLHTYVCTLQPLRHCS